MNTVDTIGEWTRDPVRLGDNSALWRNKTGEKVVLKSYSIESKKYQNWMQDTTACLLPIKHENIVATIKLDAPKFLSKLVESIAQPVLATDYCDYGDLRRILDQPENNCCGLQERELRVVLQSLSRAISYLHGLNIVHRNIRPENVLLQKKGEEIVYKLTDVAYGKTTSNSKVMNATLRGSDYYSAPELKTGLEVSYSTDYWSFGVLAFELVTGCRPFLPNRKEWLPDVQQKRSEHICIVEENNGKTIYCSSLFPENRISRNLKENLERWLFSALELDPQKRGCLVEVAGKGKVRFIEEQPNQPKLFSTLEAILEKRFLTMFSLFNYGFFSYEVTERTTMEELLSAIEASSKIPRAEIELVLPVDSQLERIEAATKPIDFYVPNYFEKPMLYVVKASALVDPNVKLLLSQTLKEVLDDVKIKLKPHFLLQFVRNAFHFIMHEELLHSTLLEALHTYTLQLNDKIIKVKPHIHQMLKNSFILKGSIEQAIFSLNQSKEKILEHRLVTLVGNLPQQWDDHCAKIEGNINALCEASDKILRRYESILKRSQEAIHNDVLIKSAEHLVDMKMVSAKFLVCRSEVNEGRTNDKSHVNLLQTVYGSIKKRDLFLRKSALSDFQRRLIDVKIELQEIGKAVEIAFSTIESLRRALRKFTLEMQNGLWRLMTKERPADYLPDFTSLTNGEAATPAMPKFKIGEAISSLGASALCFGEGPDCDSLIKDCQTLIVTTEEMINDGFKMIEAV